ncbi:MAG: hypothetical protein FD189_1195 [Elusimicrobia bacterium]|nr:MAG: hypothetical protein FD154_1649 [Elusimicrobiota bacterium]KAF0155947.1 MAG: hypothetical protein FD189_1195 [Elusimicrobiota bacterium]
MKATLLTALLAAPLFAAPAAAQVYMGGEVNPGGLVRDDGEVPPKNHLRRFAGLYAVELGTASAYSLFGGSEPVREILSLGERGFHRQELIALAGLALERGVPLGEAAALYKKTGGLEGVFRVYGLDLPYYWRRAGVIKRRLDAAEAALPPEEVSSSSDTAPGGETPP